MRRVIGVLVCLAALAQAQRMPAKLPDPVLLWPGGAPGALGSDDADKPTVTPFLPPAGRGNGTAVVICPGGGYGNLATEHEGQQISLWLNSMGVAGFVLKYRLGPKYHHPIELGDAQRAIRFVRAHAAEYRVRPERVGIWGFSAGGHLASTAATHFDAGQPDAADPIDRQGSRPDFAILAYPVISFTTTYTHQGSKRNLLGENPDPKLVESLSNELQVTPQTPPTFLFHTTEDKGVPPENSVLFYLALRKAGVPCEMHIYERGPHGVGLARFDHILGSWTDRLAGWLQTRGLL
jgi:acetyl esterase/lipase